MLLPSAWLSKTWMATHKMAHKPNFSAQLTNKAAVYETAAQLGFTQTRGSGKGKGSPREMLEAIGGGLAIVVHIADDEEYHIAKALEANARAIAKLCGEAFAEYFIKRVALALKSAQKRNAA